MSDANVRIPEEAKDRLAAIAAAVGPPSAEKPPARPVSTTPAGTAQHPWPAPALATIPLATCW